MQLARAAQLTICACLIASAAAAPRYAFDARGFPRYSIDATLSPEAHSLTVSGTAEIPRSLIGGNGLVLALTEAARQPKLEVVLPDGGRRPVDLVKREDPNVPGYGRRWVVTLPAEVKEQPAVTLAFTYTIVDNVSLMYAVDATGSFVAGGTVSWYPEVVAPDGLRMAALGRLQFHAPGVVIAGGEASRDAPSTFEIREPRFFDFAAGPYTVISSRSDRARLYLLRKHPGAEKFVGDLDRVIGILERHFGPLPQKRFDLVEADTAIARKAGFDGTSLDGFMMAIGLYFDQPFNPAFFGHEAAHQWWGTLLRRKGPEGTYLLDESLAQYGSLIAVNELQGPDAAELYRRRGSPGYYAEYSGFGYLARTLAGIDARLDSLWKADGFVARRVANTRGMIVWEMLQDTLGGDRFTRFLAKFARDHAYGRITQAQFLSELRAAAGDKAWFVDEWFSNTGVPDMSLAWSQDEAGVHVRISQTGGTYHLMAPVEMELTSGKTFARWIEVSGTATNATFAVPGRAANVALDPHYRVIRWTPEYRAEAEAILPYTEADVDLNYGRNEEGKKKLNAALQEISNDEFGLRARIERGLGDVALHFKDAAGAVSHYEAALAARPQAQDQLPELWHSLADAFELAGDKVREADARKRAAAVIDRMLHSVKNSRLQHHGAEAPLRAHSACEASLTLHPNGQRIPEHAHDWPTLSVYLIGSYVESSETGELRVNGPSAILHPAGEVHADIVGERGLETVVLAFDPAWLERGLGYRIETPIHLSGHAGCVANGIALEWLRASSSCEALLGRTIALLHAARENHVAQREPAWLGYCREQLMNPVDAMPDTAGLARALRLNRSWLAHAYRAHEGEGIHDTIRRRRVEHALVLLRETDLGAARIAGEVGFCDQSHMNRCFRSVLARTPIEARSQGALLQQLA